MKDKQIVNSQKLEVLDIKELNLFQAVQTRTNGTKERRRLKKAGWRLLNHLLDPTPKSTEFMEKIVAKHPQLEFLLVGFYHSCYLKEKE